MKVCFINPPITPYRKIMRNFDCATESKGNYLYQPYDMLLMSAQVPKEWPLLFIDAIAQVLDDETVVREIKDFHAEIIVCSVAATNWKQDFEFVKKLRSTHPDVYIFLFGDLFIEEMPCKEVAPFIDGIFTSPILFSFSDLLKIDGRKEFYSENYPGFRSSSFYSRADLKTPTRVNLGIPRHSTFQHSSYKWPFSRHLKYTTIFTAWGCPYSCAYCILSKFPNYWRGHEEVIEEMRRVKASGIKEIYIGDRSFGLPLLNVLTLLEGMIQERFDFSWSTYFHPNQYTPELLDKMKQSGCHTLIVGIESSDIASLKKYGRHVRLEQYQALLNHAKRIKMDICGDFILGLPSDTSDSIQATIQYAVKVKLDYASFNIAAPLAGSSIRAQAIKEGKMTEGEEQFDSFGRNKVISVSQVSAKDLVSFRNSAIRQFYFRPSYILRRLMKIKGSEHLIIQILEALSLIKKSFVRLKD